MTPQTLDDLFTRYPGKSFSSLTAELSRSKGESITLATHTGKFRDSHQTVEATFDGVRRFDWPTRRLAIQVNGGEWCIIRRVPPPSHQQRLDAITEMDRQTDGDNGPNALTYSKIELGLQVLDRLREAITGRSSIMWRRLGDLLPNTVICSKSAAIIDHKVGMGGRRAIYMDPDGLWDAKYGGGRGEQYAIVACSPGWCGLMIAAGVEIRRHP